MTKEEIKAYNMRIYNNVSDLCVSRNMTRASLERELSFGNAYIANLRNAARQAPYDRVVMMAEYFHVPIERITGAEKPVPTEGDGLIGKRKLVIDLFDRLTEEQQNFVIAQLQGLAQSLPTPGDRPKSE